MNEFITDRCDSATPYIDTGNLPHELQELPQWVPWASEQRAGKRTKVPKHPVRGCNASTTDFTTWGTYAEAIAACERFGYAGIGFVFTDDDLFFFVDLDACFETDGATLQAWAQMIVDSLRGWAYVERSPSGLGLHLIGRGTPPSWAKRKGQIEIYFAERFATMTGDVFDGCDQIGGDSTEIITDIHRSIFGDPPEARIPAQPAGEPLTFDDDELLQRAHGARNGDKLRRVLSGNDADYNNDTSKGDLAAVDLLAFWTDDPAQIERILRASARQRPKWDKHKTYLANTIAKGLATRSGRYAQSTQALTEPHTAIAHPPTVSGGSNQTDITGEEHICIPAAQYQALQAEIDQLRLRVREFEVLASRRADMLKNAKLAGARVLAPAVVDLIAAMEGASDAPEDGLHQITMEARFVDEQGNERKDGLAVQAGISPDTAARYLDQFEEAGLIRQASRQVWTVRDGVTRFEPRRFIGRPIDCTNTVDHADRFIAADLRRNVGGKREPRLCPACLADLDRVGTQTTVTVACCDCGSVIEERTIVQIRSTEGDPETASPNGAMPQVAASTNNHSPSSSTPQVAASPPPVTEFMPHGAVPIYVSITPQVAAWGESEDDPPAIVPSPRVAEFPSPYAYPAGVAGADRWTS